MGFTSPIINVGHADLVELPDGSWYAVMLASRLIEGAYKNLGRETFICPVVWERGWPLFSPQTGKVEWEYDAPDCLPQTEYPSEPQRYDFDEEELDQRWVFWGTPSEKFYRVEASKLILKCKKQYLNEELRPMSMGCTLSGEYFVSMLAQRQCRIDTTVTCRMHFLPKEEESAGLAVIQAMNHQFRLERVKKKKKQLLRFAVSAADYEIPPYFPGFTSETRNEILAETEWDEESVILEIDIRGEAFTIRYGSRRDELKELLCADGARINPEKVGCMSGTIIGMYATGNGTESMNQAEFDWFEMI